MISDDEFDEVVSATRDGEEAARRLSEGSPVDPAAIERHANALEVLRIGVGAGTLDAGWLRPTIEDVEAARRLAALARRPTSPDVCALALRVYRVTADPTALTSLCQAIGMLEEDVRPMSPWVDVAKLLARAIGLFERCI